MSFHMDSDRNIIGYCKPCGSKAKSVASGEVDSKLDALEKAITGK
jgi:hypothetical protein